MEKAYWITSIQIDIVFVFRCVAHQVLTRHSHGYQITTVVFLIGNHIDNSNLFNLIIGYLSQSKLHKG